MCFFSFTLYVRDFSHSDAQSYILISLIILIKVKHMFQYLVIESNELFKHENGSPLITL